jgi:hypothetical protein
MRKRVYFSFCYKDVENFRVNVVRNSNKIAETGTGYYDHSIWEEAKNTSAESLKRLINKELNNTSVTAILIGSETYRSRWVRYEIVKSLEHGNKLIGIHINSIQDKNKQTQPNGQNPFDYISMKIISNIAYFKEYLNGAWKTYAALKNFNSSNIYNICRDYYEFTNLCGQLSLFVNMYDWVINQGHLNLSTWVQS